MVCEKPFFAYAVCHAVYAKNGIGSVKGFRFMFIKTCIMYVPWRKDLKYMNMHCTMVRSTAFYVMFI